MVDRVPFHGQGMFTMSFDDGRADNYGNAFKLLQRYGLPATFNIITGWADGSWAPPSDGWGSAAGGSMTVEQIRECHQAGHEITSHGDKHIHDRDDLGTSLEKLAAWGVLDRRRITGFVSPGSDLTAANLPVMQEWFAENGLAYARTGPEFTVAERVLLKLAKLTGNTLLYRWGSAANNIAYGRLSRFLMPSHVIFSYTTLAQAKALIEDAIATRRWCVFMLHSILGKNDPGYGADLWYWDADRFAALCEWLATVPGDELLVVTMRDAVENVLSLG